MKHGYHTRDKRHPIYKAWDGMIQRCTNPKSQRWRAYGARGITVCERWRDFRKFLEDVSDLYKPGLVFDRIDNNGNYEPGNVRWTTFAESMKNRRPSAEWHAKATDRRRDSNGRFLPT